MLTSVADCMWTPAALTKTSELSRVLLWYHFSPSLCFTPFWGFALVSLLLLALNQGWSSWQLLLPLEYYSPTLFVCAWTALFNSPAPLPALLNLILTPFLFAFVRLAPTVFSFLLLWCLPPPPRLFSSILLSTLTSVNWCSHLLSSLLSSWWFSSHLHCSAPPWPLSALQTCSFIINLAL